MHATFSSRTRRGRTRARCRGSNPYTIALTKERERQRDRERDGEGERERGRESERDRDRCREERGEDREGSVTICFCFRDVASFEDMRYAFGVECFIQNLHGAGLYMFRKFLSPCSKLLLVPLPCYLVYLDGLYSQTWSCGAATLTLRVKGLGPLGNLGFSVREAGPRMWPWCGLLFGLSMLALLFYPVRMTVHIDPSSMYRSLCICTNFLVRVCSLNLYRSGCVAGPVTHLQ